MVVKTLDDAYVESWSPRIARALARLRSDLAFAAIDAATVMLGYVAAMVLRFLDSGVTVSGWWNSFLILLPVIVMVHLGANLWLGAYGHVWELASVEEAMRLVVAALASASVLICGLYGFEQLTSGSRLVPISVLVLGNGLTLGGMGAMRYRSRLFSFNRTETLGEASSTVVVGTSRAAAELARNGTRGHVDMHVVGFVSTGDRRTDKRIAGLPVLGHLEELPSVIEQHGIQQVVIADRLTNERIRDLVDVLVEIDVRLRIVQQLQDVLGNESRLTDMRDLELTDLLPRPTVTTDLDSVSELLSGRRVLVTGAGGSIGSEIARQVLAMNPAVLVALDNDETHLHDATMLWQEDGLDGFLSVLADIRDAERIGHVFAEFNPDVVFHAAAHKHVPILEGCPDEAVKTNVAGTRNLLEASRMHDVSHFVLISTDKAVDPSSVMGASKRLAEMLVQSASQHWGNKCVYSAVRFGNVLGSRGSVVPTFMRQIRSGGPVTISDPDMLRYFMTVNEAVHLVLQSAALSEGGEVFVLDMGEPVRIGDLARRMIRLAGLVPGKNIEVTVTGARPGEKMVEVLSREPLEPGPHQKIRVAAPSYPPAVTLADAVEDLSTLADYGKQGEIRELLHALAWHNWPADEVVYLDQPESIVRPA